MNYIRLILSIAPFLVCVTAILYTALYLFFKNKRAKPRKMKVFAEFVLAGWVCTFVYVTQILSFGNGMGELYNLVPFGDFTVAFRYGSNNAHLVWQNLLNIFMFVPLGFLLPIVFPCKMRHYKGVLFVSSVSSFATEVMQLLTQRGTDINDLIANTIGGICGFALWLLAYGAIEIIKQKPLRQYMKQTVIGIVILCLTAMPFITVSFFDGRSEFGNYYYTHLIPKAVHVPASISREEVVRKVYKATTRYDLGAVQATLKSATGMSGDFSQNGKYGNGVWSLDENLFGIADETVQIFIHEDQYNTWSVNYHYPTKQQTESPKIDKSLLPNETDALNIAWGRLSDFGITHETVEYAGLMPDWGDEAIYLSFESIESTDTQVIHGNVIVTIAENGEIYSIDDNRIWCDFVKEVPCISPQASIRIAEQVGVGTWNVTADVTAVKSEYSLIKETGYLVPTWKIVATTDADPQFSNILDWNPMIDAIK